MSWARAAAVILGLGVVLGVSGAEDASKERGEVSGELRPVMVVELFRHGARSADIEFSDDGKARYANKQSGVLQSNGLREHYLLGRMVRENYAQLFDPTKGFEGVSMVKVYSSDTDRTILSATGHMMGMFPYGTGLNITGLSSNNSKILLPPYNYKSKEADSLIQQTNFALPQGFNPVPIHVKDASTDTLFMKKMKKACPWGHTLQKLSYGRLSLDLDRFIDSIGDELKKKGYNCNEIFGKKCKSISGVKGKWSLKNVAMFADSVRSHYYLNGVLPVGISDELFVKLKRMFGIYYIAKRYSHPKVLKSYITGILKLTKNGFHDKSQNNSTLNYIGLSGHEENLFPLLLALNQTSLECLLEGLSPDTKQPTGTTSPKPCLPPPPFSSNLIFELLQDPSSQNHYIRLKYNNDPISIKNTNSTLFTLEEFDKLVDELSFDQRMLKEFCFGAKSGRTSNIVIFIVLGLIITVAFLAGRVYLWARPRENDNLSSLFQQDALAEEKAYQIGEEGVSSQQ